VRKNLRNGCVTVHTKRLFELPTPGSEVLRRPGSIPRDLQGYPEKSCFAWQDFLKTRASQLISKTLRSPTSHRGRALPRKWGTLGAKPAARRESEPVSPPTKSHLPAQRSSFSERGCGGGSLKFGLFFSVVPEACLLPVVAVPSSRATIPAIRGVGRICGPDVLPDEQVRT
jgi:hypothetical protein